MGSQLKSQERNSDFASEESFGQAAKRFEEHYGWQVQRSKIRREVENIARLAFTYVEQRLVRLSKTSLES